MLPLMKHVHLLLPSETCVFVAYLLQIIPFRGMSLNAMFSLLLRGLSVTQKIPILMSTTYARLDDLLLLSFVFHSVGVYRPSVYERLVVNWFGRVPLERVQIIRGRVTRSVSLMYISRA